MDILNFRRLGLVVAAGALVCLPGCSSNVESEAAASPEEGTSASEQAFLDHVHASTDLTEADYITVGVGEQICYELANGTASGIPVREEFAQSSYTSAEQDAIYTYAQQDLCP